MSDLTNLQYATNENTLYSTSGGIASSTQQDMNALKLEKLKMTSTLIIQQTKALIKNGYYSKSNNNLNTIDETHYQNQAIKESDYEESGAMPFKNTIVNMSEINQMCSYCLLNTIQEDVSHNSTLCSKCCHSIAGSSVQQQVKQQPIVYEDMYTYSSSTTSATSSSSSIDRTDLTYTSNTNFSSSSQDTIDISTQSDEIRVCCYQYDAKNAGDLNLKYGERVKILYFSPNNQYLLVQALETGKLGYVPCFCLTTLNRFLSI